MKTRILFLITLLCAVVASLQSVHAATITVMNTNDSGAGSLRQALTDASDPGTINFDSSLNGQTIILTSGELVVYKDVTISGPGANMLAVDGNAASRVFHIAPGKTVTISGLTITNGNDATLGGGGIFNESATLTVSNCTVSGNSAAGLGGGIYNRDTPGNAMLTVSNSTISGNSAGVRGGGLYNRSITQLPGTQQATLTVSNSTLSGNSAGAIAGGIYNEAVIPPAVATLTVTNCTLSGDAGGGIANFAGTLTIGSTILNDSGSFGNIVYQGGVITSNGYNLSSDDASAFLNQASDQNTTDPLLGPLQPNGGSTFTHKLLTGSPAIDNGKNFSASTTDQRGTGFSRTFDDPAILNATGGDGTDIGAFEVQRAEADLLIGIGVDKTTVRQGDLLTYTITVRNFGPDTAMNALVNDVLASGSTFVSAHANRGVFTGPPVGQTGTVTWYVGDILNSGQESAQIVVTVIVRGNTTITNTGSVSSQTDDPNTANNTASITVSVAKGGGGGHGH